jgi:uncharacterized cupin superfamily protein
MSNRYFVRAEDVPDYHPANHTGTVNTRLIDPKLTGAKNIEIVCETLQPGYGAPRIEHVCHAGIAEVDGQRQQLGPGDCCCFPADMQHVLTAVGATPCNVLVIYSPPYKEAPSRVIR